VVDARTGDDVQARFGDADDEGDPTQAVPVVEASGPGGAALFDDERAGTSGTFFGSDAIR
jgi:hypothetical protein